MEYFNRKCTKLIAWGLHEGEIEGESVKSASLKASDETSGNESSDTSDYSNGPVVSGLRAKELERGDFPEHSLEPGNLPSRAVNHLKKSDKATKQTSNNDKGNQAREIDKDKQGHKIDKGKQVDGSKQHKTKERAIKRIMVYGTVKGERNLIFFKLGKHQNVAKLWDSEDPNRHNNDLKRHLLGFEYESPHSLAADENLELEPFPDYIEPDPAEFGQIAEDILDFGAGNEDHSTSTSESSTSVSSDFEDTPNSSENIVNFRPLNQKPSFKFTPSSSLSSRLPDFLASMKAANKSLQADIIAGKQDHILEINGVTKDEREKERPYIEMNLGLGVLEETASHGDSSHDSPNEHDGSIGSTIDTAAQKSTNKKSVNIEEL
jgi:hypothetical protein